MSLTIYRDRDAEPAIRRSLAREQRTGLGLVALFFVGIGGWAAMTDLEGAVLAAGQVVVDSEVKIVQHPYGGVVGRIAITDGQHVGAGEVIVQLDETVERATLSSIQKQLDEATGQRARLEAERDGLDDVVFPEEYTRRAGEVGVGRIITDERRLFKSRRDSRTGQKAQLRERIAQYKEQIVGSDGQQRAKRKEIEYIADEKAGVQELVSKKLLPISRLSAMLRDEARLMGEAEQLRAATAQARGHIAEIELQILQLDQDTRTEVLKDLRDVQARIGELEEKRTAARDRVSRVEIRAPQAGIVHQLAVHTVGGVIAPREVIAQIVPFNQTLAIDARVAAHDIDQIYIGQKAFLRLSAFSRQSTPELEGEVTRVSATIIQEKDNSAHPPSYSVRISLPESELAKLGNHKVIPGMPIEVHMRTEARSALSYLVKPLFDSLNRAGRER